MSNFIARFFRGSGRILLSIGAILLLGMVFLSFIPQTTDHTTIDHTQSNSDSATIVVDKSNTDNHDTKTSLIASTTVSTFGVILSIAILAGLIATLFACNNRIRKLIAGLASFSHCNIYTLELFLATAIWGFVTILVYHLDPIIAIATLFALIANLLCFILAWLIYGQPVYSL